MSVFDLLDTLSGDEWRKTNDFSTDFYEVGKVLLNPYARVDEKKSAIRCWLAKYQPCVFGRLAAKTDRLRIVILEERDLQDSDENLQERLKAERSIWKRESLEGGGKHGFLLAVLSDKLQFAAPDNAYRALASHLRRLLVPQMQTVRDLVGNDLTMEYLYLRSPVDKALFRFKVILDFFASAGDRRWWHDHRFPGGLAFTLNSLGHMLRTREWYENKIDLLEWSAKLGMQTIANANPHPEFGPATRLLDLENGKPRKSMKCLSEEVSKVAIDARNEVEATLAFLRGWLDEPLSAADL
jgi:hypothetical protein